MKPLKHNSKIAKVLDYLKTGHSLDIPKATAMWGCIRLSDAIFRLRNKGYPVQTQIVQSESSDVKYAIYRMPRMPSKDTPLGTKVRVLQTVRCAEDWKVPTGGVITAHLPDDVDGTIKVTWSPEGERSYSLSWHPYELEIIQ